jgi:amidase
MPSATQVAADVRAGRRTPREVIDTYLDRIERMDSHIGAFQIVDADGARAQADHLAERADLADLPLAGVPVAIKDSIDVAGLPTRCGSAATTAQPRDSDDLLVRRLRDAGAVVVGKTRLPELAIWHFTESPIHGGTRNPLDPDRNAGGSTGGGAAAVAAGLVPIAHGADGGGSLRIPAGNCGVVGFRPSRGAVPLGGGLDDHWFGCTAHGAIAANVTDVALALDVLAGTNQWRDPTPPGRPLRIAVSMGSPSPIARPDATARASVTTAARLARAAGHTLVKADPPYPLSLVNEWVRRWHAGVALEVRQLGLPIDALEPRTRTIVAKGERLLRHGRPRSDDGRDWRRRLAAWFESFDVLISPVVARPSPPMGWGANASYLRAYIDGASRVPYTQAWNVAGYPALSLPVWLPALTEGRPGAVQIAAPGGQESLVLAVALQLEAGNPRPAAKV